MILEKQKKLVNRKKIVKAQMKGKMNKRIQKEKKKILNEQKRKLKQQNIKMEAKKIQKRLKEKERRKNKKITDNNKNDERILNVILDTINNNCKFKKHFDFTYASQKFDSREILMEVLMHIKYAIPWRRTEYKYSTIYSIYKKLLNLEIITKSYIELLRKYINVNPSEKLKIQSTDVTIIPNKYGSRLVQYNGHKKRKCTKSSQIHDSNGIVIGMKLDLGAKHDSKIFIEHLDEPLFISNELNNQYKEYMLADSGYDSLEIKSKLKNLGYKHIIYPNKRNNKNPPKLSEKDMQIYKTRMKATEHSYSSEKTHRRINTRYDKNIKSLYGAFYVSFIDLILKKQ